MKKIFSLLGLLMLLTSSAWADLTPTVVVENDFSTTGPLFANKSRGTVEHNTADGNVKFTSSDRTTNGYGSSTYSFGDLTKDASAVKVEFDYWIANGACNYDVAFIIRDASVAAGHAKQAMGTAGAFFSVGRTRQSSTNFFSVNRAKSKSASADNLGVWTHVEVYVDYETKKVDYKVSQLGGNTIQEGTEVDYLSSDAAKVSEIDFFYCVNNEVDYLDNLKITKYVDNSSKPTKYTVNYLNEQGQALKQAASYDTMSGLEFTASNDDMASFTNEGSTEKYNYLSGNEKKVASKTESENVINLTFKTFVSTDYTVKSSTGNDLASGKAFFDGSTTVYYPEYILSNGTWYKTNSPYGVTITAADNIIPYQATQYSAGSMYFFECEKLNVSHSPAATNEGTGYSGGKSPRLYLNSYWYSEPIENGGKFTVSVPYLNGNSTDGVIDIYTRDANGNLYETGVSITAPTKTSGTLTSGEFVINPGYSVVVKNPSAEYNSNVYMDYLLLKKTADYVATENLTINDAEITIGQNTQMSATLNPSNASNKTLTWTIKESNSINAGEAEIDAATGEITPLKAGLIAVEVTNGEKTDIKEFTIAAAQFDVTITDAPQEAQVFVGDDASVENKLYVSTKDGYDNMQNTSLLQPVGSVTATKIPTYIYSITVDKKNKTVDVVYEEDIEVTAMNFEVTDQRIALGNSRTLQVTYSPANASFKTAKWTSSNPEVATVDENTGLVTAVSEGETTITAEWSENAEHETNISTQMTLTVDKGLVLDRIVYDELDDATAEVMGYYHPLDGDTLFLPAYIESNGRMIPVSFIKQEAFIGSNPKSIVIPGTVKIIDHRAMMYSNTHNAYEELPEDGLESAFLLEGVEVMRDRIFHGNKYMKKVFLPSTLTDIGYYSFFDTAIEDVYFGGTEEQWNALKNLENAKLPETAKLHFNSNFTAAFINSIEVEEDYAEIAVGEEYEIEASIIPEEIAPVVALTYTSSNEEVATVDEEGVVTGIADGYVTITVSAGEGVEAKVRVKVGDAQQERENVLTMDFEDGEVADYWALAIAESQLVEPTAEGSTGRAAAVVSGSDRGDYVKVNADLEGATKYEVSMDLLLYKSPKTTQFSVLNASSWDTWTTNWGMFWKDTKAQSHNPFLFNMDIPASNTANINTDFDADGNAIPAQQTWDFENGVWYTLTLAVDVNAHTVDYAIAPKSDLSAVAVSGTYTAPADEMMQIKGIYERNGRYNYSPGAIAIDNVIVDVTERGFVEGQGGNQATGINEAKAEKSVKNGKYVENGQIVIYIDGKKFNAAGQELK